MAQNAVANSPKRIGWLARTDKIISGILLYKVSNDVLPWLTMSFIVITCVANLIGVVFRRVPAVALYLSGVVDLTQVSMAVISIGSIAYVWYLGAHIRITFIVDMIKKPRIRAVMDALATLLFLIWMILLVLGMGRQFQEAFRYGIGTLSIRIPYWPFELLFIVIMSHFALVLLRSLIGLIIKASGHAVEHDGLY